MGRVRPVEHYARFEAAQTSRLNSAHWEKAADTGINSILATWLSILRGRAAYEAQNNPDVEGVICTHCADIVGEDGPILQVRGSGKRYAKALEKLWADWWAMPDANEVLSGADWLSLCIRMLWTCGEHLTQITGVETDGPQLRIRAIHPRRLDTPASMYGDPNVILGVRRTPEGRPTHYEIAEANVNNNLIGLTTASNEIAAQYILHDFTTTEPDQARGVPWLAACLDTVADLRDYINQVMDAARAAADSGVLLYNLQPDAQSMVVNESTEIERRTMSTLPPGYQAMQIRSEQPSTQYSDFVADRLRSVGRAVGMPLMIIRLDSSGHNYSSARFDSQIYQISVRKLQARFERRLLNRLVMSLATESENMGLLANRPDDLELKWIWPRFPHVDPSKESEAAQKRLTIGTSSIQDECAAENRDWEITVEQRKEYMEACKAAGLPLPVWMTGPPKPEPKQETKPAEPDADETPKAKSQEPNKT